MCNKYFFLFIIIHLKSIIYFEILYIAHILYIVSIFVYTISFSLFDTHFKKLKNIKNTDIIIGKITSF